MPSSNPSSVFTTAPDAGRAFGPPMIGALLRVPWEAVQRHMLERLHERGFGDLDAAHLNVFQYPGPQGARPTELATRLRISKQALNYLLGELERLDYLRSKRVALTRRGTAAVNVIREAVAEMETTWAQQLGPERFTQLRELLLELNQQTSPASRGVGEHAGGRSRKEAGGARA